MTKAQWCQYIQELSAGLDSAEFQANARLIAAAPALLEACKYALAWSIERSETKRKWTVNDQNTHERLKDAIAQAEGRED